MNQNAASTLHVAVLDDDAASRDLITSALSNVGYSTRSFATIDEFWKDFKEGPPYCVLLDLLISGESGLRICQHFATHARSVVSFALITANSDVSAAVEAMKLGAIDVLEKPIASQHLLDVVSRGVKTARLHRQRQAESREVQRRFDSLTPRENEVLQALMEGRVSKEIAGQLGISARTVDVHRSRIMQKLGLSSLSQLARLLTVLYRDRDLTGRSLHFHSGGSSHLFASSRFHLAVDLAAVGQ